MPLKSVVETQNCADEHDTVLEAHTVYLHKKWIQCVCCQWLSKRLEVLLDHNKDIPFKARVIWERLFSFIRPYKQKCKYWPYDSSSEFTFSTSNNESHKLSRFASYFTEEPTVLSTHKRQCYVSGIHHDIFLSVVARMSDMFFTRLPEMPVKYFYHHPNIRQCLQ